MPFGSPRRVVAAPGAAPGTGTDYAVEGLLRHRDAAHHRRFARRVGIEGERHAARQLLDLADVLLGDRAADAGHHVAKAVLMRQHHIHIALDDHHAVAALDALARQVEPVERRALVEEHASAAY